MNAHGRLILALFFDPLEISPLPFKLSLVRVDLPLLLGLFLFLSLQLVSDQGAGSQSERAADGGSRAGRAHGRADDASYGGTAQRADSGAFLPGG
jgi:hypothetical protein